MSFVAHFGFSGLFEVLPFLLSVAGLCYGVGWGVTNFFVRTLDRKKGSDGVYEGEAYRTLCNLPRILTFLSLVLYFLVTLLAYSWSYSKGNFFDSLNQMLFFLGLGWFSGIGLAVLLYSSIASSVALTYARDLDKKQISSLSWKFILPVVATVIFKNVILGLTIYEYIYANQLKTQANALTELAQKIGKNAQVILEVPLDEMRSFSHIFDLHLKNQSRVSRGEYQSHFKNYLEARSNFFGVGFLFQRNQFDGKDDQFKNSLYSDATGQFMVYHFRDSSGNIISEPLNSYDTPDSKSDWYKVPMRTGREFISEPYQYETSKGIRELLTVAIPILKAGNPVGVAALDFEVATLSKILQEGIEHHFLIYTRSGLVIASDSSDWIGKNISILFPGKEQELRELQTGSSLALRIPAFQEKCHLYGGTMQIGFTESHWKTAVIIPDSQIQKETEVLNFFILLMILLISCIVGTIVYLMAAPISRSLRAFVSNFAKARDGYTNTRCSGLEFSSNREVAILAEGFNQLMSRIGESIRITQNSLRQTVERLSGFEAKSVELASSSQNQAASIEETTAALEEIGASVEMIATTSKEQTNIASKTRVSVEEQTSLLHRLTEVTKNTGTLSAKTTTEAEKGNQLMQGTRESMTRIDESTRKIAEMVSSIQEISDQVNLLALNAAIEAARAGDQGRGFAVVASEIGKLAEHTQSNTKQISELVRQGMKDVSLGRENVEGTDQVFKSILVSAEKTKQGMESVSDFLKTSVEEAQKNLKLASDLAELSDGIALSTSEQKESNNEILRSVNTINESTQIIAETSELISQGVTDSKQRIDEALKAMEFFKMD